MTGSVPDAGQCLVAGVQQPDEKIGRLAWLGAAVAAIGDLDQVGREIDPADRDRVVGDEHVGCPLAAETRPASRWALGDRVAADEEAARDLLGGVGLIRQKTWSLVLPSTFPVEPGNSHGIWNSPRVAAAVRALRGGAAGPTFAVARRASVSGDLEAGLEARPIPCVAAPRPMHPHPVMSYVQSVVHAREPP